MTCSYCATELPAGAMFCGECGRAVAHRSSPPERSRAEALSAPQKLVEPIVETFDQIEPDQPQLQSGTADPDPDPDPDTPLPQLPETEVCAQCGATVEASDIFCGECGFVRQVNVPVAGRARDTVALDPFPWGATQAGEPSDLTDDLDETRIVDRSVKGDRFVLQFSTGDSVSVTGTGLVGRNPHPEPGEYFDAIVAISDPGKSVSKTHLEFGQEGGAFWISDRFSGNGTFFREPGSEPRRCDSGKRYRVVRGTRVDIGEQFFVVS